jgi:hypothetical protein
VQALPSLQLAVLLVCVQALPVQASLVQGFASSHCALVVQQFAIGVRTHVPTGALSVALNAGPFVSAPF